MHHTGSFQSAARLMAERIAIYPNCSAAERRDRLCVELRRFAQQPMEAIEFGVM